MGISRRALIAAAYISALANAAPAFAQSVIKWDLSSEYAATSLPGRTNIYFADRIKTLSAGKLDVTVHFSGALGFKASDHYTAVEDGALPMASTPFNRMNGIYPIFDLQSLPFLQSTIDEAEALDRVLRPFYNNAMAKNGQFVLFTMPWTPQGFWAKKPINSKDDLKGLRVRVVDLAAVQTLKTAGADAIQMSWGDTLPAISTAAINGVLTSDDGGLSAKFPEAGLNSFSAVGFTVGVEMVHMNRKAFDALSPALQTVVLTAAGDAQVYGWSISRKTVVDNLAKMKAQGVSVVDAPSPEFRAYLKEAAAAPVNAWKKKFGPQADMILDLYANAIKPN